MQNRSLIFKLGILNNMEIHVLMNFELLVIEINLSEKNNLSMLERKDRYFDITGTIIYVFHSFLFCDIL